jgi:hypothetical protein
MGGYIDGATPPATVGSKDFIIGIPICPNKVVHNCFDTFKKLDGVVKFAAYLLTLGLSIGQSSNAQLLIIIWVFLVFVIVVAELL